jgi:hypothetical protein
VKNSSFTNTNTLKRLSTLYTDYPSSNQDDSESKNVYTYTTRTTLAKKNSNLSFDARPNFTNIKGPSSLNSHVKTDYKWVKNEEQKNSNNA